MSPMYIILVSENVRESHDGHLTIPAYSNATAYSMDVIAIRDINEGMTYNAVHAVDQLCKNLKFFVLQTGTNV
jgi:hypothetical protein